MIYLKTEEEIQLIKDSAQVLGKRTLRLLTGLNRELPRKSLMQLLRIISEVTVVYLPLKGFNKFPASLCISVNEVVVHGIPGSYVLKDGDIVSIDCGVKLNGFHSDSAYTYPVGEVSKQVMDLLTATKKSLYKGIEQAVDGLRIGDIGFAVQDYVEQRGYTVVRELVGHGVGRDLHESPEVPNYGKRGKGIRLREGMVLAIEPMINLGLRQ
jgi:methionyl aminopeptidase